MLPSNLLRTKVTRQKIFPKFCQSQFGNGTDYELANKILLKFKNFSQEKYSKTRITNELENLENEYDFKLVRGFTTLLERRCSFKDTGIFSPIEIREKIFELSSRLGFATTKEKRDEILFEISNNLKISPAQLQNNLWSDLEDNLILDNFAPISTQELIFWYNLSLLQTLMFRSLDFEFSINGGRFWKGIFWRIKQLDLMYFLQPQKDNDIFCKLEGPGTLIFNTERYGNNFAKLIPFILRCPNWKISSKISKKNQIGEKIYDFSITESEHRDFFFNSENPEKFSSHEELEFDSKLEEKFAKNFLLMDSGWNLEREPNPLIAGSQAMIPDFLFSKYDQKVYFEIVGFWTKDYLNKKFKKINQIFDSLKNNSKENNFNFLIGINKKLKCSSNESLPSENIFYFSDEVTLKPILRFLKEIEKKVIQSINSGPELNYDSEILSISEIALKQKIPELIIEKTIEKKNDYVQAGKFFISKKILNNLLNQLKESSSFIEACKHFEKSKIPPSCHPNVLQVLGYEVIWKDLLPENAIIKKKFSKNFN